MRLERSGVVWLVVLAVGLSVVSCGRKKAESPAEPPKAEERTAQAPAKAAPRPSKPAAAPQPAAVEYYGVLREFQGDVKVAGRPAEPGMRVRNGETVRVAKGYAIVATAPRGDLVRIFSDTVTEFVATGPSPHLRLRDGKLWLTVRKLGPGQRFQVETVNAVAGVRGTDFIVERKADTTRVGVMEGLVAVQDLEGNEVVLKPNEQTKVVADRPPEPPSAFNGKFEISLWEAILAFFRRMVGG